MTGVMYLVASRTASIATSKQSAGEFAEITASGASPWRPKSACSRSACSGFVGIPVDGPARWALITMSGSSVATASPNASPLSATPAPELEVTPSAPANEAPIAEQIAAISSSA